MSTKLSFKEVLGRWDASKASARARSASRGVRLMLRAGEMVRPVDVARLLAKHGLSLRKAHGALERLAAGESVAIELQATDKKSFAPNCPSSGSWRARSPSPRRT